MQVLRDKGLFGLSPLEPKTLSPIGQYKSDTIISCTNCVRARQIQNQKSARLWPFGLCPSGKRVDLFFTQTNRKLTLSIFDIKILIRGVKVPTSCRTSNLILRVETNLLAEISPNHENIAPRQEKQK